MIVEHVLQVEDLIGFVGKPVNLYRETLDIFCVHSELEHGMDGLLEVAVRKLWRLEFVIADNRGDHPVFCDFQGFLIFEHFKDILGVPPLVLDLDLEEYLFNFSTGLMFLVRSDPEIQLCLDHSICYFII